MINFNPDLLNFLDMIGGNANQDMGYSSGQQYAQSIAGGQNVPGMIAPGVSYSAARPEGYTQADLQYYNPGPAPVMPSAPTQGTPSAPNEGFVQMPSAPQGVAMPTKFGGISMPSGTVGMEDFDGTGMSPIPLDLTKFNPYGLGVQSDQVSATERYSPIIKDQESLKNLTDLFNANTPITPVIEDLPSVGSSPIDFSFNPFIDNLPYAPVEIDPMPQPVDVPVDAMPTYTVPETPVKFLQDNPTGPVDMPAEVFEDRMEDIMDYDDLQDIVRNKDFLTQIPAEDGVRNQYQVELDNYINESENKKETYLDTFPIGGAFNLGIPNIFENVVAPAVIPGLGIVKEAAQSFNPSPSPSPSPSFTAPSSGGRFYNDNTRFLLR